MEPKLASILHPTASGERVSASKPDHLATPAAESSQPLNPRPVNATRRQLAAPPEEPLPKLARSRICGCNCVICRLIRVVLFRRCHATRLPPNIRRGGSVAITSSNYTKGNGLQNLVYAPHRSDEGVSRPRVYFLEAVLALGTRRFFGCKFDCMGCQSAGHVYIIVFTPKTFRLSPSRISSSTRLCCFHSFLKSSVNSLPFFASFCPAILTYTFFASLFKLLGRSNLFKPLIYIALDPV